MKRADDYRRDWRGAGPVDTDRRAYQMGFKRGFWTAAAFYAIGSLVLILAFRALGMHP